VYKQTVTWVEICGDDAWFWILSVTEASSTVSPLSTHLTFVDESGAHCGKRYLAATEQKFNNTDYVDGIRIVKKNLE